MEIKRIYDDFLCEKSGIIIDDAYDIYKKNEYKKYIRENGEIFIYSQDNCIDYLIEMPNIKYISLPREVEDLSVLYKKSDIEGLCIYSSAYNRLDLSKIKSISKLEIYFDSKLDNELLDVEEIKLIGNIYSPELKNLRFGKRLKKLEISFFKNLIILENIPRSLHSLTLDYCLKLRDLSALKSINDLLELQINDCNKIENLYDTISKIKTIKILKLFNKETQVINHIKSIDFIENMAELECFISDYLVDDNNLKPLLRIKNKELWRWKNKYNIKI